MYYVYVYQNILRYVNVLLLEICDFPNVSRRLR